MQKMNVIAKISCNLECSVVTLKMCKEYLNTVIHTTSVLMWMKNWTVWYIEGYSMSTYMGVTNWQKTVWFFGPPCTWSVLAWSCMRRWDVVNNWPTCRLLILHSTAHSWLCILILDWFALYMYSLTYLHCTDYGICRNYSAYSIT